MNEQNCKGILPCASFFKFDFRNKLSIPSDFSYCTFHFFLVLIEKFTMFCFVSGQFALLHVIPEMPLLFIEVIYYSINNPVEVTT